MEQSLIYNLIKKFPYPFIVRHNRLQVYGQHPQLDYALLWKYSIRCSILGFIIGKFMKRPWTFALIAPLPLIIKMLFEQHNLRKEGKYQQVFKFQNWQVKKKINEIQKKEQQIQVVKQKNIQLETNIAFKENYFGQKVVSTKQFIKRLPKQYF